MGRIIVKSPTAQDTLHKNEGTRLGLDSESMHRLTANIVGEVKPLVCFVRILNIKYYIFYLTHLCVVITVTRNSFANICSLKTNGGALQEYNQ